MAKQLLSNRDMEIIILGQYDSSQNSRVVSVEGISPALANGDKDGMPKK